MQALRTPAAPETYAGLPCHPRVGAGGKRNTDPMLVQDRMRPYLNTYFGGSLSYLPNVGVAIEFGGVYRRALDWKWSWEVEFTYQFLDDEFFADDGNPRSREWYQLHIGAKGATCPQARRHFTLRTGAAWFYAGENPNIVDEKGHYFGVFVGVGFETDMAEGFTMGPELSTMLMVHEKGKFVVVPQFNWHFLFNF